MNRQVRLHWIAPSEAVRWFPTGDAKPVLDLTRDLKRGESRRTLSEPFFSIRIETAPHTNRTSKTFPLYRKEYFS